ncbi:hypothetical protein ACTFIR_010051 [Dictyostelium discoideum]
MGSMFIREDEYKWYPLNNNVGKLLDISVIRGTMNKILYFGEFLQEMFAEEKLDGVIIKRNLSKEEFENFENKYEEFQFEYEPNEGLVIIFQNLTTGCGHSKCISALATIFFGANNHYQGGDVIDQYFKSSIPLEADVIRQPDISLAPVGRVPPFPTVVVEAAVSQSTLHLIDKCYKFLRNQYILMVIGVRIYPKQADGTFKAIAFVITRNGLYGNAVSIHSFGSCRTTETDEQNFLNLVNLYQQQQAQQLNTNIFRGVLSTNILQNNTPNDPQFTINIPFNILLNGAFPIPVPLQNTNPINLEIDLYFIKTKLETIENNLPFTSIFQ